MAQEHTNDTTPQPPSNNEDTAEANQKVKIKKEKLDPEIEKKIKLLKQEPNIEKRGTNGLSENADKDSQESEDDDEDSDDSQSSSLDQDCEEEAEEDDKKNIEPVKSSNEILTELFKVFNVAPPEELLDDKNLIKKAKKHKKEKKKHKKKKTGGEDTDNDVEEPLTGEKSKHKKKKKHKHKNKDGSKVKEKDKGKSKDKEKTKDKSKDSKKIKESDKIKDGDNSKEKVRSRDRAKSKEINKKNKEKDIKKEPLDKSDKSSQKSSTERKRHHDKDLVLEDSSKRRKPDERDSRHTQNSFYNGFSKDGDRSRERSRDRDKHRDSRKDGRERDFKIKKEFVESRRIRKVSEDGLISEISLSDEETYLKEKDVRSSDYSKRKVHNSFYDGITRSRSRDRDRDRNRDRGHSKDHYRDRDRDRDSFYRNRGTSRRYHSRYSRSRSRSRSRSHDLGIDKKRLLEIARKNAISMFKRGNLPGCDNMSQEIKDKVLLKMRYGGRTVEDLTEFCKKISKGEDLSELSSDEDSDVDKAGNTKAFHHPFQLTEREPIVMHIRNSKPILPILPKTDEQTKSITMQFPVSSGQQHRMTEHWVPVETKDNLAPLPDLPAVTQSSSIFKTSIPKNALGKTLPIAEEQEPAFKPVPPPTTEETPATTTDKADEAVAEQTPAVTTEIPIAVPPPTFQLETAAAATVVEENSSAAASTFVPDVPVPSTSNSIFPRTAASSLDVSSIISKRLNAMRRLQDNPMDSEALKMMYNSQKEMSSWASSKHLPGQFIGSTGVNVLRPNELHSGPQVWARRDQLTSSKPVTGGMGMHLLQKMGWKPGEGLGREKNGSLQPLLLDVKLDKRGLVAEEDRGGRKLSAGKKRGGASIAQAQQTIEEKHPVCLLNELTSKRKWTPPLYTLVNEKGPSHSKMFLFSVQVNGQSFTPDRASNTKKEAKMIAAKYCLQQIGILSGC